RELTKNESITLALENNNSEVDSLNDEKNQNAGDQSTSSISPMSILGERRKRKMASKHGKNKKRNFDDGDDLHDGRATG
ncbi:unnamed protein product, partial [Amoebophrya sp. A120]